MMMNKRVLVTGAGGFIGSHLCEELVKRGYNVRAFLRYNSRNFWGWLDSSPQKNHIEIIAADIRNYDSVKKSMQDIDTVFHLAALIGIPFSYYSPDAYVDTNIKGTLNVLQAAIETGVKRMVHTSTSEVYGTAQAVPISEKHPINPQSPYAATKAGADSLALSFNHSFGLPVSVVRPFNTYGPRQSARAVIPTIITQLLSGKTKIKLGSVFPTRDLTYVEDVSEAFIKVAESSKSIGEIINIGSNFEISIAGLVELISAIIGRKCEIELDKQRQRPPNSEVERLFADIRKAKDILSWSPRHSLERGLEKTIEWFKSQKDIYKADIYNV